MMPTKELVQKAGYELGDLVALVFNDVPNSKEIPQFALVGFEAVKALADAITRVPREQRVAALSHFLAALHARANEIVPALRLE